MNTEDRLDHMSKLVENKLKTCEESRNSDKRLIYEILTDYYNLTIPYVEFKTFPSFESIRRVRQKIQSEGKLRPTNKEVLKIRHMEEEEYHNYFKEGKLC